MENKPICSSCKKRIANEPGYVRFMCPGCGKQEMVRCKICRKNAVKYTCSECGFTGPN